MPVRMPIQNRSLEDLRAQYCAALDWLSERNIEVAGTRFELCVDAVCTAPAEA